MRFKGVSLLVSLYLIGVSCTSSRSVAGRYQYKSSYTNILLTLHDDMTFVQNGKFEMCFSFNFFGRYTKKGNKLFLKNIYPETELINEKSIVTTSLDNDFKGFGIYVYFNGEPVEDSTKVVFDNGRVYYTSSNGVIYLTEVLNPKFIQINSPFGSKPFTYVLDTKVKFNKIYISIMDSIGISCDNSFFIPELFIRGRKLEIPRSKILSKARKSKKSFLERID
jgi:hypothetical protein